MRVFLFSIFFLLPILAFAYTSVIANPETQTTVLPIANPQESQDFFGELTDFPHTFEFTVSKEFLFSASVYTHDVPDQKNDISIILIKEEKRGVSEIKRTKIGEQTWESKNDPLLVESFKSGGQIASVLKEGTYRLEVSSPNNEGKYRLQLGEDGVSRGYFENVRMLFEVKSFLGTSKFTLLQSPLIYWPLLILVLFGTGIYIYMYRRRNTVKN